MKKLLLFAIVILFTVGLTNKVTAQDVVTTSASAEILIPINIEEVATLEFGILAITGEGTISISADAEGTIVNDETITLVSDGPDRVAGQYTVVGSPNYAYDIDAPSSIDLDGSEGGTMTVALDIKSGSGTGTADAGTLDASGDDVIFVGGTLTIGATQAPGTYTKGFDITVNYN